MIRKFSLILLLFAVTVLVSHAQQADSISLEADTIKFSESDAYIIFKGDSLFTINASLWPYSPDERAKSISERLEKLADQIVFVQDSFNISEVNNYSIISYKDNF